MRNRPRPSRASSSTAQLSQPEGSRVEVLYPSTVINEMKAAVENMVKGLVANPDAVEIIESTDGKNVRFEVRVSEGDMGRLIGREGRTVKAIRSILFAAGQKQGKRYHLDILD